MLPSILSNRNSYKLIVFYGRSRISRIFSKFTGYLGDFGPLKKVCASNLFPEKKSLSTFFPPKKVLAPLFFLKESTGPPKKSIQKCFQIPVFLEKKSSPPFFLFKNVIDHLSIIPARVPHNFDPSLSSIVMESRRAKEYLLRFIGD